MIGVARDPFTALVFVNAFYRVGNQLEELVRQWRTETVEWCFSYHWLITKNMDSDLGQLELDWQNFHDQFSPVSQLDQECLTEHILKWLAQQEVFTEINSCVM